jgi:nucleotide-binding universal stress UspA family protein
MDKILTLTDFSPLADLAVEATFKIAKSYGAEVAIYHNLENSSIISLGKNQKKNNIMDLEDKKDIDKYIDKYQSLSGKYGVKVQMYWGTKKLTLEVSKLVEQLKIDLIIMGSEGAGGKKEFIWGSNAEKVVKSVHCPVLIIKDEMKDFYFDNIIFASSFDLKERAVFKQFLNLIKPPHDTKIHLVAINTASFYSQPRSLMVSAMEDFQELAKPWKSEIYFYSDYSVDAGLRHFMEEIKPDLLVMSNKHKKPLKHLFSANHTIKMVNHSDFPVLTIDYIEDMTKINTVNDATHSIKSETRPSL